MDLSGCGPLPRTAAMDHAGNHGGSWARTPTFGQQHGNYPFVAENLDRVMGWLNKDFKTKRVFFECYWGLSKTRDHLDPAKNLLVKKSVHRLHMLNLHSFRSRKRFFRQRLS